MKKDFKEFFSDLKDHMKKSGIRKSYKRESEILSLEELLKKIEIQSQK